MLRNKPAFRYCGLTIVLSKPSRFDLKRNQLLTAGASLLMYEFLQPEFNVAMCDVRLKEDISPLLENTKCILVCGESAAKVWCNDENPLGAIRGSIYWYDGRLTNDKCTIPIIPTFFPQDAKDIIDYESEYNPEQDSVTTDDLDDNEAESTIDAKRHHGRTKRKNYRFWLQQDIKKCKTILKSGVPKRLIEPNYVLAPPSKVVIEILTNTKNAELFIDLETYMPSCDIKCIGFSFDKSSDIYVVPFYSHDYSWAYSNLSNILRALAIALRDNCTIAHNGAHFDYFILAWKYRIPIGHKVKDTMIMFHRTFSSVEKSLGHLISWGTYELFHKDEGDTGYFTPQQVRKTLEYCGKDVFTMKLAYYNMLEYASKIPGLLQSYDNANAAIRPYLICTLQGMLFDDDKRQSIIGENDRLMMQYLRMLKILVGEDNLKFIRGKGKSAMPGSNPQCVTYFHEMLGYPVVSYGKVKKDGTRGPSLGKKNMLKLKLHHDNPVIDIVLAYREVAKETGSLKFIPWDLKHQTLDVEQIKEPTEQIEMII